MNPTNAADVVSQTKTTREAAATLGISRHALRRLLKREERERARKNDFPGYGKIGVAPEGMTSRGVSALRDGKTGEVLQVWDKLREAGRDPEEALKPTDAMTLAGLSTMMDNEGQIRAQWARYKPEAQKQAELWQAFGAALAEKIKPAKPIKAPKGRHYSNEHLACFPIGDHHLGMMAWDQETGDDYNDEISSQLLDDAVQTLIRKAPDCGQALLAVLGDFMHYDGWKPVTPTGGNLLDASSRFPKMVQMAAQAMIRTIDQLRAAYPKVHVMFEIGNHDLASTIWMMTMLDLYYRDDPRVTVDISPRHFHYFKFGKNLIGTHHGHGTKLESLPGIMAYDCPEWWGQTEHRFFWVGHYHHKAIVAKDYVGCEVEQFRVLATQDAWASQHGYRSKRDMSVIVMHAEDGIVDRSFITPKALARRAA